MCIEGARKPNLAFARGLLLFVLSALGGRALELLMCLVTAVRQPGLLLPELLPAFDALEDRVARARARAVLRDFLVAGLPSLGQLGFTCGKGAAGERCRTKHR